MKLKKLSTALVSFTAISLFVFATHVAGQSDADYSYAAQKRFIPKELGQTFLGMPLKDFLSNFDLAKAEVGDTRFDSIPIKIPVNKGNIETIFVKGTGITADDLKPATRVETEQIAETSGQEFAVEKVRIDAQKLPVTSLVYEIHITYRKGFDLKSMGTRTYGANGVVRKPDDEFHFYDTQWTFTTPDDLKWLVRSFHESDGRTLILIGRIPGTEWSIN